MRQVIRCIIASVLLLLTPETSGQDSYWKPALDEPFTKDDRGEHWHLFGELQVRIVRIDKVEYDEKQKCIVFTFEAREETRLTLELHYAEMTLGHRLRQVFDPKGRQLESLKDMKQLIDKQAVIFYCWRCMTVLRIDTFDVDSHGRTRT